MIKKLALAVLPFFLAILSATFLFGREADKDNGTVNGKIVSHEGKPVAAVTVRLKGTGKTALTGEDGTFVLRNVKPGNYELEASFVGYEDVIKSVTVDEKKTSNVEIQLNISQAQIDEVTVRAVKNGYKENNPSSTLRINESLLEAPQNIQVITGKALADQQVISMNDGITRNVSGAMRIEHWGDQYANIVMRGARASAFRNGMNITDNWGPLTEDMSYVDHIEFVKGPAGFMMSNGEPSGLYNVVTKKPTGVTKGEASIMMGSYDLFRSTLDLDGKLDKAGRLLYRLNVAGQTKNSFRKYEFNNRYSIAPVLSYKIDDNTTITAEYVYQNVKSSNIGSYYMFATDGYAKVGREASMLVPDMEPNKIKDESFTVNLQHNIDEHWKLTAQASYFNYSEVGGSMWFASDASWNPIVYSNGDVVRRVTIADAARENKYGQIFLNGDVKTGVVRHRILTGLDLGNRDYVGDWNQFYDLDLNQDGKRFNIYNPLTQAPTAGVGTFDRSKSVRERASSTGHVALSYTGVYFQDELGFFDNKLRVTLAGRYTSAQNIEYYVPEPMKAKRFTPRIGVSYSVDNATAVYALYDQSFIPQSGMRRDGKGLLPLTGNNMELGVKRDWFNGKWTSGLSVYRIIKNNQTAADPASTPGNSYVLQLGQTRTKGVELDIRGELVRGLNFIGNYAYTDSRVSKNEKGESVKNGALVPGYAKHTANGWLTYRAQQGVLKGFGVSGGFTYLVDRTTWYSGADNGGQDLPDYFKLDAGLSWEKNKIGINVNVFNLLDKYLYSGTYYAFYKLYYWQAEAGRNFRAGITYKF
ncbi:iron complex outermembrane receptor protein [Filimonas zeae]|uniref:Ferrichrome-iron receptor n=1 Tax=Filimonas zeae TaxID=1737353 RepID=A0A917MY84_9BACT|nr:TonB-dependent receptor [Filimonas zeae]MDR6340769.1 iron complex outermembrane receptor protein [Filimonas zeae]GGH78525.1 ferrichrome-iron receptor [Filimonas zeae]